MAARSVGCDAERLVALPFWQGWGAVALCGALVAVAALVMLRPGWAAAVAAWTACAALVTTAFPLHLLFELPAAVSGRPTDWLDVANRLLLLSGGLLFGMAAASASPRRCAHAPGSRPRPVPAWARGWAYAGVAVPVTGWMVPHGLWVLGVPFGITANELAAIMRDIGLGSAIAVTVVPALGSLLTLGLAHRWGQVFPRWVPSLGGRRVPRMLALVPAGLVALALTAYGLIGTGSMTAALVTGTVMWPELASAWMVAATLLVFLAWGVALGVATVGYWLATRPDCEVCGPTRGQRLAHGSVGTRPVDQ